jgi:D-lyxose ketol-isomerase
MADVNLPAGEQVTLAETAYTVQVHNTGSENATVGGTFLEPGGRMTVYPTAWQPVVASSDKGTSLDVVVTPIGSVEPVMTDAVSHSEPAPAEQAEPVAPEASVPVDKEPS